MATLYLQDFVFQNSFKDIYAVTWQLAYDEKFTEIFFEDRMDTKNIYRVNIALDPVFVRDPYKEVYARVKLHFKADNDRIINSDWFVLKEERDEVDNLILKKNGFSIGFINRKDRGFKVLTIDEFIKEKREEELKAAKKSS